MLSPSLLTPHLFSFLYIILFFYFYYDIFFFFFQYSFNTLWFMLFFSFPLFFSYFSLLFLFFFFPSPFLHFTTNPFHYLLMISLYIYVSLLQSRHSLFTSPYPCLLINTSYITSLLFPLLINLFCPFHSQVLHGDSLRSLWKKTVSSFFLFFFLTHQSSFVFLNLTNSSITPLPSPSIHTPHACLTHVFTSPTFSSDLASLTFSNPAPPSPR